MVPVSKVGLARFRKGLCQALDRFQQQQLRSFKVIYSLMLKMRWNESEVFKSPPPSRFRSLTVPRCARPLVLLCSVHLIHPAVLSMRGALHLFFSNPQLGGPHRQPPRPECPLPLRQPKMYKTTKHMAASLWATESCSRRTILYLVLLPP